jgi:hypothetical protein
MAGSASNWFRPSKGPLAGQAVYINRAQRAGFSRNQVLKGLNLGTQRSMDAANKTRPAGTAKTGGVKKPAPKLSSAQEVLKAQGVDEAFLRRSYGDQAVDRAMSLPDASVKSGLAIRTKQASQRERFDNLLNTVTGVPPGLHGPIENGPYTVTNVRGYQVIDKRTGDPAVHPTMRTKFKTLQAAIHMSGWMDAAYQVEVTGKIYPFRSSGKHSVAWQQKHGRS